MRIRMKTNKEQNVNKLKLLLMSVALISSSAFANNAVEEIKQGLDHNGVKLIDWYKKGDTEFAETERKAYVAKVALNETKGMATVKTSGLTFAYMGVAICNQLTNLIPHEKTERSWSDDHPYSDDEKVIQSVIYLDSPVGKKNEAELNGWQITFKADSITDFSCSVIKRKS